MESFAKDDPAKKIDPIKEENKDNWNLTSYLPTYLLYHEDVSKVQASFKYKILRKKPLYLGYTHNIYWKLNEESRPIYDTNYNPELFYRFSIKNKFLDNIDLITGHKSNGKDFEESRSFDYSGVQFNSLYKVDNMLLTSGIRVRSTYGFDAPNADLIDYQGPFEFNFSVSQFMASTIDKAELSIRIFSGGRWGEYFGKGGQEISLAFRIMGVEITPSFIIQYYNGYNDSLQNYNQRQEVVRFGFLL